VQLHFYFLLALVPLGYLMAFLRYNISKQRKIFMGDTGSMVTGFLIAVLSLRFLSLDLAQLDTLHIQPENLLLLTMGILFVMTTDALRVVVIRLWHKKAFFKPDRNHVHHILIDAGLSHRLASFIITGYGMLMSLLFYLINLHLSVLSLWLVFGVAMLFTMALLFQLDQKYRAPKKEPIANTKIPVKVQIVRTKLKRVAIHIFRLFF
jgi:UDP-N-acetylmuramyl pentapeptide phosphotransferase/UDP-N-acetylglucosamine-1-phosphate transferase